MSSSPVGDVFFFGPPAKWRRRTTERNRTVTSASRTSTGDAFAYGPLPKRRMRDIEQGRSAAPSRRGSRGERPASKGASKRSERRITDTAGRRRRRGLAVSVGIVGLLGALALAPAFAVHQDGLFELDENATDNLHTTRLGSLNGGITSVASSLVICQEISDADRGAAPFDILIDEEQITVGLSAPAGGGGCAASSVKRTYSTLTRGVGLTDPAAHSNNDDVTLLKPGTFDGDDWDTLVAGGGSASRFAFETDGIDAADGDAFTGGNSKDTINMTDWLWTTDGNHAVNDKNDLEHLYAASYVNAQNHQIFYFGSDRYSNDGAAALGFWFLQDKVEQDPDGTFDKAGTDTPADHTEGDVLVQTDFTTGGTIDRIQAYVWDPPGGVEFAGVPVAPSQGFLERIATGADCDASAATDDFCGNVNRGPVPAPWDYDSKQEGNDITSFPRATFFEGGLDVTAVLGHSVCVGQLLGESRQSPSETSVLEDKVLTDFDVCAISVEKNGPTLSKVGDDAAYTVTITNDGAITLYKEEIVDSLVGDLTDGTNTAIVTDDCGDSLDPGASCTITYSYTVQEGDPDPLLNTVDVVYDTQSDLLGIEVTDSADFSVNLFQPAVEITKTGDATSKVGDDVTYTFTINNRSSADSPNLLIDSIDDDVIGDLAADATTAGCDELTADDGTDGSGTDECTFQVTRTVVDTDPDPLVNTVTVHYHPDGFTNDITAFDSHSVDLVHPDYTIDKACGPATVQVGGTVTYTFTIVNTGDVSLDLKTASDSLLGDVKAQFTTQGAGVLSIGETATVTLTRTVLGTDPDTLTNTITTVYMLDSATGLPNELERTDSCSVQVQKEKQGLFHTQTTCANFIAGTGLPIVDGDIRYGLRNNGTIRNVSPGVFFFYATFTHPGGVVLDVDLHEFLNQDESATTPGSATSSDFVVNNNQAFLYRVNGTTCTVVSSVTKTFTNGGADVRIVTNGSVAAGTYVLGVKYTPSPTLTDGNDFPCGNEGGVAPKCRYWFVPSLGVAQLNDRAVNFLFQKK